SDVCSADLRARQEARSRDRDEEPPQTGLHRTDFGAGCRNLLRAWVVRDTVKIGIFKGSGMKPGALKVNALIMLVSSCLALWATAQQAPHDLGDLAGQPGALPPYVVVPDPRPWEADRFRATELRYTLRGAIPSEARPSYTAEEAGLTRLEKGSALVFHSP